MSDTSKRGRAAEYRVAAHFLDQGYEVCWPASEGGCVDLWAVPPNGTPLRVQVKRVYEARRKQSLYYRIRLRDESDALRRGGRGRGSVCSGVYTIDSFDLLAASAADGPLWLIPVEKILGKGAIDLERINEKLGPGGPKKIDWSAYRVR